MRNPSMLLCSAGILTSIAAPLAASDPIGIYAVIDKVVFEPSDGPAERVQVWGAFALARRDDRDAYVDPRRGYLYYSLEPGKEEACRAQWNDLRRVAASGQCIAMGSRSAKPPRVRRGFEKAEKPDSYVTGFGLSRWRRDIDYGPVRGVLLIPAPASPVDGAAVVPGKVQLVCRNPAWKLKEDARCFFAIEGRDGSREMSGPIELGEEKTAWSPALELEAGIEYTWKAWVKDGDREGPGATASFKADGKPASDGEDKAKSKVEDKARKKAEDKGEKPATETP